MIVSNPSIIGPWVVKRTGGSWCEGRGQAIGKVVNGELVAGVLYEDFSGTNVVCHIAGEGSWADRHFLGVIFDYPFNQMKALRITVPVCGSNIKSQRLVEHMGFVLESRLEKATLNSDLLLYRLFKGECKYLNGKYAESVKKAS